ncbi:MAG: hypothetical protein U9O94_02755, partial [Nanoarchaeota archaeon]|nr:hypothetical protein [Nanoarchaeota archaeon]
GNYGEQTITTIGWKEIDITDLYNLWKEGVYTNYGIKLIYNAVSSLPDICTISSTESAYSSNLFTDGLVDTDKVWKTNGSKPFNTYNFIGFAKDSVSADATVRVIAPYAKVSGMEDEDLANLVPGEKYYLSDTLLGYITKTPPDYAYDVGIALTTTTLFSSVGSKYAHGVESLATTDDGYKIHSVGFRPILVKIDAIGDVNGASYTATSHGSGDAAHENCIYGVTDEATYSRGTNETYIAYLETALVGGDTTGDLTKLGKTTFIIDWTVLEETVYKWEAFG